MTTWLFAGHRQWSVCRPSGGDAAGSARECYTGTDNERDSTDPKSSDHRVDANSLTQGYHRVRLEYYEGGGPAAVRLGWAALR
jgi:hypothetical protein